MLAAGTTSLLDRIRNGGSQHDWQALVARYWRVIYAYGRRHGLTEADAEDFTQDLLIELTRVLPGFEYDKSRGSFRAYLQTITSRRLIDRLRASPPDTRSLPAPDPQAREEEAWWATEWRRSMLRAALHASASAVEPKTFQAFQLVVLDDWSPKRAAAFLDISVDSVYQAKARVSRHARAAFERLEREEDEHG